MNCVINCVIMAVSVRLVLHPHYKNIDGSRTIAIEFNDNRKRSYLSLNVKTIEKHWDKNNSKLKKGWNPDRYEKTNQELKFELRKADEIISRFKIDNQFLNFNIFKDSLKNKSDKNISVYEAFNNKMKELESIGKKSNSDYYKTARNKLFQFHPNKNLQFEEITPNFLRQYENFIKNNSRGGVEKKNKPNTIGRYMRDLRTIYNSNVEDKSKYPFRSGVNRKGYKIPKEPGRNRALSFEELRKFIEARPSVNDPLFLSWSLFIFSLYNRGMNFADMANLTWDDIENNELKYNRQKTNAPFLFKIHESTINIIEHFRDIKTSKYVFNIYHEIHKTNKQKENRRKSMLKKINSDLIDLALTVGISINGFTSYVARHTWAYIQQTKGESIYLIQQGLGHKSITTTEIYLKSLGSEELDRTNSNLPIIEN